MKKIEKTLKAIEKFISEKDLSKYRKDGVKYVYGASTHTKSKGDGYQFWMYFTKLNDEQFKKEFIRRTSIVGDVIEVCISEEKAEKKAEKKEDKKTAKEIAYEQFLEEKRKITAQNRAKRSNV